MDDAIGCQTKIAAQIVAGGGDYLLALKDNHPTLHRQVLEYFLKLHAEPLPSEAYTLETRARGRSEELYDTAATLPAGLFGQEVVGSDHDHDHACRQDDD